MYADESLSNITLSELDRLNGKTHILYPDQRLSSSTAAFSSGVASSSASALHDTPRSRATSVTISDIAEGGNALPSPLFHSIDNLHGTLMQDLRDFSLGIVPPAVELALFDYPSVKDASDDVDMSMSMSPAPRTSQETAKAKAPSPPETARVPLQSQPHGLPRQPPPPHHSYSPPSPVPAPALVAAAPTSSHTSYFHTALLQHDPQPLTFFSEPRRTSTIPLNYFGGGSSSSASSSASGSGFSATGGAYTSITFPPGFQGGWGSGFGHSPIVLDSSWNSFVEQLGF